MNVLENIFISHRLVAQQEIERQNFRVRGSGGDAVPNRDHGLCCYLSRRVGGLEWGSASTLTWNDMSRIRLIAHS
jgi:hypothetical protein